MNLKISIRCLTAVLCSSMLLSTVSMAASADQKPLTKVTILSDSKEYANNTVISNANSVTNTFLTVQDIYTINADNSQNDNYATALDMDSFVVSDKSVQDKLQVAINQELDSKKKIIIFGEKDTLDPNDVYKMFDIEDVGYSLKSKNSNYFEEKGFKVDKEVESENNEDNFESLEVKDSIPYQAPVIENQDLRIDDKEEATQDQTPDESDLSMKNNTDDNAEIKPIEGENGKFIGMSVESASNGLKVVTRYYTQREELNTKEQYVAHMAQCDSISKIEECIKQNTAEKQNQDHVQLLSNESNGDGYSWLRIDTVYSDNQHANVQMVYYLTRLNGSGYKQQWEFTTVLNVSAYNNKDHQIDYGYVLSSVDFPGQHVLGYWPDVKIGQTSGSIGISATASKSPSISFSASLNYSFDDIQISKRYEPNFNECRWSYDYFRDTPASKQGSTLVHKLTFEDESNYIVMGQTNYGFEIVDTRWIGNQGSDYLNHVGLIFTCDSETK